VNHDHLKRRRMDFQHFMNTSIKRFDFQFSNFDMLKSRVCKGMIGEVFFRLRIFLIQIQCNQ